MTSKLVLIAPITTLGNPLGSDLNATHSVTRNLLFLAEGAGHGRDGRRSAAGSALLAAIYGSSGKDRVELSRGSYTIPGCAMSVPGMFHCAFLVLEGRITSPVLGIVGGFNSSTACGPSFILCRTVPPVGLHSLHHRFQEGSIQTKVEDPLAEGPLPSSLTSLRPSVASFLTFTQAIFPRTVFSRSEQPFSASPTRKYWFPARPTSR